MRLSRRNFSNGVYNIRAIQWRTLVIGSGGSLSSSGALSFALSDFVTNAYSSNWDYYKMNKIVVTIHPTRNVAQVPTSTNPGYGFLTGQTTIDNDDITQPPQGNKPPFSGMSQARTWLSQRRHTRVFIPRPNVLTFGNLSTSHYAFEGGRNKLWMNCGQPGTPHYGFKYWMEQPAQGLTQYFRLEIKAYITFRKFLDPGPDSTSGSFGGAVGVVG